MKRKPLFAAAAALFLCLTLTACFETMGAALCLTPPKKC